MVNETLNVEPPVELFAEEKKPPLASLSVSVVVPVLVVGAPEDDSSCSVTASFVVAFAVGEVEASVTFTCVGGRPLTVKLWVC